MSLKYAESKILEAYKLSKGNKTKVNQVIDVLAKQDINLLKGLTQQYLKGIIAAQVDRVLSGKTNASTTQKRAKPVNFKQMTKQEQQQPEANDFGKEILSAASSTTAEVFGFDSGAPVPPPQKASQSHIDAIHQMAARAKTKMRF